ncbi:type VII secretion protein EssB [Sporosarcina sp. NPDC096371]|uniref:type VII secretion protein EssB n=1 Tax=Sporosarcina sp. NPDC096371 TaxID=3364530 RepID=UPI003803FFB0
MSNKKQSYLESLLDSEMHEEGNKRTFVFQKERIGLKSSTAIEFVKEADAEIKKEIVVTEDELIIHAYPPPSFKKFEALSVEDEKTRWIFAYQLVEKVRTHAYPRLNLVICPENIVYSTGMTPYFIHYGVMESLPPFEENTERNWLELKATVAAAVDSSRTFEEYVKYHETLELKEIGQLIMSMGDSESLLAVIQDQLARIVEKEKHYIELPRKKWKTSKWLAIGLGLSLVPALILTFYFLIYEMPRNEAYLDSHEQYLTHRYSEVVTILSQHSVKHMPYVVLYELAHSFVMNEELTEEQKKNVLNNISLQTDTDYLKYWIYIGRSEAVKAIDLARLMEDGELITYGLLKRREEIQAETNLTGEEKQQMLKEIDNEVDEYKKLMGQEKEREQVQGEEQKQEQVIEPKQEQVIEPKQEQVIEPKQEQVIEPKQEQVIEPKQEQVIEPKQEQVIEQK